MLMCFYHKCSTRHPCRHLLTILIIIGSVFASHRGFAQTPDSLLPYNAMKKLTLEELMNIEVTSVSRHPEKLDEAASAIQVITQEDIRHSGAKTLPEALRLAANLQVAQAGCHYAVSTPSISIAAAGGAGQFDVLQTSDPITCGGATQDRCLWTAQSDVPWITVTTSMPQIGDNRVSFTVTANPGTSARTGRIAVRDKIVQITQSGQ